MNQHATCTLALNAFAAATVDWRGGGGGGGAGRYPLRTNPPPAAPGEEPLCLSADSAAAAFLSPHAALLSTRDGALYLLHLLSAPHAPQVRAPSPALLCTTTLPHCARCGRSSRGCG